LYANFTFCFSFWGTSVPRPLVRPPPREPLYCKILGTPMQTTTAFKRCCILVLRNQFFRRRNALKERSAAHDYTGRNSIKRISCSTSTNRLRTFGTIISRNTLCASDSVLILYLFANICCWMLQTVTVDCICTLVWYAISRLPDGITVATYCNILWSLPIVEPTHYKYLRGPAPPPPHDRRLCHRPCWRFP